MTLVLRADDRDLGIVRLGTLRPTGFSHLDVARARAAAEAAADDMSEELCRSGLQPTRVALEAEATDAKQGVVILDELERIVVVSPVAERLLGWHSEDVVGAPCASVFDCRDADGASLCGRCGLLGIFERQEVSAPVFMRMADAHGGRQEVSTSFWYLPPAGRINEPRAMAVLRSAEQPTAPLQSRAG